MIKAELIGGEQLVARLGLFGPRLRGGLEQSIARMTMELLRRVKADKLSGQVLKVRTGRLRRSINERLEGQGTTQVTGTVGTNVVYGKVHEYGGLMTVRAHQRRMTQAFGKPVTPRMVDVKQHTVNYPARSFLRTALAELEPVIKAELQRGVREALK